MPHHLLLSHCLVLQYFLIIYNPQMHTRLFSLHHPESLPFPMLSCFEMPYPNLVHLLGITTSAPFALYFIIFVPSHSKSASLVSAISATTILSVLPPTPSLPERLPVNSRPCTPPVQSLQISLFFSSFSSSFALHIHDFFSPRAQ